MSVVGDVIKQLALVYMFIFDKHIYFVHINVNYQVIPECGGYIAGHWAPGQGIIVHASEGKSTPGKVFAFGCYMLLYVVMCCYVFEPEPLKGHAL